DDLARHEVAEEPREALGDLLGAEGVAIPRPRPGLPVVPGPVALAVALEQADDRLVLLEGALAEPLLLVGQELRERLGDRLARLLFGLRPGGLPSNAPRLGGPLPLRDSLSARGGLWPAPAPVSGSPAARWPGGGPNHSFGPKATISLPLRTTSQPRTAAG